MHLRSRSSHGKPRPLAGWWGSTAATGFWLAQQGRTVSLAGVLTLACLLACVSVPEKRTGRLPAPKDEGLPPRGSTCASQRLDLGDELGDGASKHTTAPQPGERTTTRYGWNNDSSDEYDELQVKPFMPSCACMHASARKPLRVYWDGQEVLDKTPQGTTEWQSLPAVGCSSGRSIDGPTRFRKD
jgi:hypothetical protein